MRCRGTCAQSPQESAARRQQPEKAKTRAYRAPPESGAWFPKAQLRRPQYHADDDASIQRRLCHAATRPQCEVTTVLVLQRGIIQ